MYELIVGRPPTENQRQMIEHFLVQTQDRLEAAGECDTELRSLAIACHAVFASSQFQYLE